MKNRAFKHSLSFFIAFLIGVLFIQSCKKQELIVPDQKAFYLTNPARGTYRITAAGQTFRIPVGLTAVAEGSRTVTFTVSSPTGAVAGTHYNLSSNTLTFTDGKAVDSIVVAAVFSQYLAGRVDTLVFTINEADRSPNLRSTYTLVITGPCFEGSVNLNTLLGAYRNTNEDYGGAYGPYTTTVTAVMPLTATTGRITVANLYDYGWNPVVFTLDWTDPVNRKVTLVQQSGIGDAGTISSTYAGQDISVRPHSNGQVGTFSVCNQTIQLKLQLGVTGVGWFGTLYTVNMAR